MLIVSNQFDKLDDCIAEAALGHITWSQSLAMMAPLAGADSMSMDLVFGSNLAVTSLGAVGFDDATVDAYASQYHRIDPRIAFVQNMGGQGVIFDNEIEQSDPSDQHREFWSWLQQSNSPRNASILVMPCVGDTRIMLALHRETPQGNSADTVQFFNKFYDKLNAVSTMIRLDHHDHRHPPSPALPLRNIDRFEFCVDETMQVKNADDVTRYRLPLTGLARLGEEDRLSALPSAFNLAIGSTLQGANVDPEIEVTLQTPLADTIAKISAVVGPDGTRLAKVSVTYLKHKSETVQIFMSSFGLTRRQAELLQAMRRLYSLDDAAKLMSISRNTARVFLGQIYDRTGVRRKADLLRLADRFV
jgi:DNA-binding CsgD family transcriptional regulator